MRRLHIAGSTAPDADPALVRDAHTIVHATVHGWVARGGTVVCGLGGDPRLSADKNVSYIFDWTVAEAALEALHSGHAAPRTEDGSLLCVRTSRHAHDQIPAHRRAVYEALVGAGAMDLQLLPDTWRSGALMRRAQAELGGVLVTVSGGAGVEDLANLYAGAGRPIIPLDIDVGSALGDGAAGGGTGLARRALADAGAFLRLADGSSPAARLAGLVLRGNGPSAAHVARQLLALLDDLDPPCAFCVRLMDPGHRDYADVERFFTDVVWPVLEANGLRVVDLGRDRQEQAWMNAEIFDTLHTAELTFVDLTASRPNCFIELGYALGRGHRTIVSARVGEAMPFDADKLPWHFWHQGAAPPQARKALREHLVRFGVRAPLVEPARFV